MYGMMIDVGPNFYGISSPPPMCPQGQGHGLRIFMLKFYIKVFRTSLFPNTLMDSVNVWYMYEDIDWLNILNNTIPTSIMISRSWT